jgi:type IV pilus assembly protein PilA
VIARIRKAQEERDGGFTLIELLVVIIIIGILAAIAIPVFLRQREKGYKAAMKSDLKNAATAQESYATDNNGSYTANKASLEGEGYTESDGVTLAVVSAATVDGGFCLSATHDNLQGPPVVTFYYESAGDNAGVPTTTACA